MASSFLDWGTWPGAFYLAGNCGGSPALGIVVTIPGYAAQTEETQ
jgi:hypothetical protein